jgi:hypothetical protein
MQSPRNSRTVARGVLAAVVIGATLAACAAVGRPVDPERPTDASRQAWSQRLEAQSAAYRQAKMWQAWTLRLDAQGDEYRQARMSDAWSERLTEMAEARGYGPGMSDQARTAWSERLTRLAEDLLAEQ